MTNLLKFFPCISLFLFLSEQHLILKKLLCLVSLLSLFYCYFLNCRIIALQCGCWFLPYNNINQPHIYRYIYRGYIYMYICIYSASHLSILGHHRMPGWAPCVTQSMVFNTDSHWNHLRSFAKPGSPMLETLI